MLVLWIIFSTFVFVFISAFAFAFAFVFVFVFVFVLFLFFKVGQHLDAWLVALWIRFGLNKDLVLSSGATLKEI